MSYEEVARREINRQMREEEDKQRELKQLEQLKKKYEGV